MSVYALATGSLIGDPIRRSGQRGDFATATLKVHSEGGEYILVSVIAFDAAELLLSHRQGDAIAVAGRGGVRTWVGKDGETKAGLSLVADQVASVASARRSDADRRRSARTAA